MYLIEIREEQKAHGHFLRLMTYKPICVDVIIEFEKSTLESKSFERTYDRILQTAQMRANFLGIPLAADPVYELDSIFQFHKPARVIDQEARVPHISVSTPDRLADLVRSGRVKCFTLCPRHFHLPLNFFQSRCAFIASRLGTSCESNFDCCHL